MGQVTDESNIGVVLWFVLLVVVNGTWIGMDLWLRAHHHEYLTTEFREGLANQMVGPFLAFATAGTVAAFVTHMWATKQ
jgi:hypothetical protein